LGNYHPVFKGFSENYGVFYPLQTFTSDRDIDFSNIPICVESSNEKNKILLEKKAQLEKIIWSFKGQTPKASREENWPALPSINERLNSIVWVQWRSTSAPTQTMIDGYKIIIEENIYQKSSGKIKNATQFVGNSLSKTYTRFFSNKEDK